MVVRLSVEEAPWRAHVRSVAASVDGLVPVVKGNGYGFGRRRLFREAATFAAEVAVGTVSEAVSVAAEGVQPTTVTVLTPTLQVPPDLPANAVLTVGSEAHVRALRDAGWRGRVHVKLRSSMHRYGVEPDRLEALLGAAGSAGLTPFGYLLHPPLLEGDRAEDETLGEVDAWMPFLDPGLPVSVSHLTLAGHRALRSRHPHRQVRLRLGTTLWHGDKSFLQLSTEVLDRHELPRESRAGYRLIRIVDGGTVVLVGAGTAHGVAPLPDGRSPFHFERQRLTMLEAPHMHTSMLLVGRNQPTPAVGDRIDVQRPLITTYPDEVVWR